RSWRRYAIRRCGIKFAPWVPSRCPGARQNLANSSAANMKSGPAWWPSPARDRGNARLQAPPNMDTKSIATKADVAKSALVPVSRLLRPTSIAIVGISPEPGSFGATMLSSLKSFDYRGAIHLVSRSRSEAFGRPCAPSIDDLPMDIDLAVLCLPRAGVGDAI